MSRKTKNSRNYENLNKGCFRAAGLYDIPVIRPESCKPCEFIGFNYASSCRKREDKGIHFFLDDYQFIRLWNSIDSYIPMLSQYACVLSPDFSLYLDYPRALQIYNHYRKHWLGAYMQESGIRVIPTIGWSDRESFEWCFDGEPVHGTVAVSSIGTQRNEEAKKRFLEGYNEMQTRLQPETILFYGKVPESCGGNVVELKAFQARFTESKEAEFSLMRKGGGIEEWEDGEAHLE